MQVHLSGKYIPMVILLSQNVYYTSLPSTVATLLATHLMAVMQPSRYFIFYNGDTSIQLGLPWQNHTPVSISILKPPLGVIEAILLKPQVSSVV